MKKKSTKIIFDKRYLLIGFIIGSIIGFFYMYFLDIYTINKQFAIQESQEEVYVTDQVSSKARVVEVQYIEITDIADVAIYNMQRELDGIESIEDREQWFIAYRNIIDKYSLWIDPPETIYDVFTLYEINLIWRTVETECYGADFDSKCNVASVIFNRLESGYYGDSIEEVITSVNQFAYGRENINLDTIRSVEYAFMIEDTTNGCIAFRSDQSPTVWYGLDYVFTDNVGHHFYR